MKTINPKGSFTTKIAMVLAALIFTTSALFSQKWQWVNHYNPSGFYSVNFSDMNTDAVGNSYAIGNIGEPTVMGTYTLTGIGSYGQFIVKYDSNGTVKWAKQPLSKGLQYYRIQTDADENSYVIGTFSVSATIDNFTLTASGAISSSGNSVYDLVIVKYDPNGNVVWAKQAGEITSGGNYDISISNGNSYVTGAFSETAVLGSYSFSVTATAYPMATFLSKYDNNGNLLWANKATTIGSMPRIYPSAIGTDEAGNSYVTGNFSGTATFDTITISGIGGYNLFIVKYDPAGNALWAKQAGDANVASSASSYNISVDATHYNLHITGSFHETIAFDTFTLTTGSNSNY